MSVELVTQGSEVEDTTTTLSDLTVESLAEAVFTGFSAKYRERTSREMVRDIIAQMDLSEFIPSDTVPRLLLCRLKFTGEKQLTDADHTQPITYDQTFASGVNIVLIPDNNVGKSSIFKTIKFALTGDNSDYDADVKQWIKRVWLSFTLDGHPYTVLLATLDDGLRAILVAGAVFQDIEVVAQSESVFFDVTGVGLVQEELQHFFFRQLGLNVLAWTQEDQRKLGDTLAVLHTSWKTYFQALMIPDSSDNYLLCDSDHAIGNQEGLILSTFLGLRLTEPMNRFHIGKRETDVVLRREQQQSDKEREQAEQRAGELRAARAAVQGELATLQARVAERQQLLTQSEPAVRLNQVREQAVAADAELEFLEAQRKQITAQLTRDRSRARNLQEAIDLALHFTGLEVNLCPNCDAEVDEGAIAHEHDAHVCRLCGKPATTATVDELRAKKEEVKALEQTIRETERHRERIAQELSRVRQRIEQLNREASNLHALLQQGITAALPTPQEDAEKSRLLAEFGRLDAQVRLEEQRATSRTETISALEMRSRIIDKARDILRKFAVNLNAETLGQLTGLTHEIVHLIGAESVDSLICSPLGRIRLIKNGVPVGSFTSIRNQGERWRIKLAFFLAMMQLGQKSRFGRHPGLLLIDQPGTAEMVSQDLLALARIFHRIDQEYANVQVLCFSAQEEFRTATSAEKVYGPQADGFAF